MPRSQTDLIQAALQNLGVLDAVYGGGSAEDVTAVQGRVTSVLDDLLKRRVVSAAINPALIADSIFDNLVVILAERVAPAFNRATNWDIIGAAETLIRRNDRLDVSASALVRSALDYLEAAGADTSAITPTTLAAAVPQVLADIQVRRVATIANEAAVQPAQMPHLVTLLAARVQPKGVTVDAIAFAEARLRELDRLTSGSSGALVQAILEQFVLMGGTSNAVDAGLVGRRVQGVLDELALRDVIYIPGTDDVQPSAFGDLVRYVAASLLPVPSYDIMRMSERRLRELKQVCEPLPPIRADYF